MMGAKSAPAAGEDDDSSDSLESWERCVTDVILDSILESAKVIGKEDGEALASFFEKFPSGVFSDKYGLSSHPAKRPAQADDIGLSRAP